MAPAARAGRRCYLESARPSAQVPFEFVARGVAVYVLRNRIIVRYQIARALLSRPRILILDEATANLDFSTEGDVKRALLKAREGRTMLVIAHRLSMVELADRVVVLDGGRVAEEGTFAELRAGNGWFSEFVHSAGLKETASPTG